MLILKTASHTADVTEINLNMKMVRLPFYSFDYDSFLDDQIGHISPIVEFM